MSDNLTKLQILSYRLKDLYIERGGHLDEIQEPVQKSSIRNPGEEASGDITSTQTSETDSPLHHKYTPMSRRGIGVSDEKAKEPPIINAFKVSTPVKCPHIGRNGRVCGVNAYGPFCGTHIKLKCHVADLAAVGLESRYDQLRPARIARYVEAKKLKMGDLE